MLPYHQLHVLYVLGSGLLALLAFRASRRLTPGARLLVAMVGVAAACFGAALLAPTFFDFRDARGFAVVSLTFYADGLWLPLFALVDVVLRRRPGRAVAAPPADGRRRASAWGDLGLSAFSAVAIAASLWAMLVEPNRLEVRRERVEVAAWSASVEPFVVVHLSDLQTVGATAREREAVRLVNALEPDLVVVSGDYIAGPFEEPGPAIDAARAFLGALRARHGIVVVAGHSEPGWARDRIFDGLDLDYLCNEEREIELDDGRGIRIRGLDVERPDPGPVPSVPAPEGTVRIAVSHVPDESSRLTGRGFLLHLAGHTHGGQIVVPGFGAPLILSELPRRFARGLFRFEDHLLNVCAGLGMEGNHAPRIRLFCPPELCVIELVGAGAGGLGDLPRGSEPTLR